MEPTCCGSQVSLIPQPARNMVCRVKGAARASLCPALTTSPLTPADNAQQLSACGKPAAGTPFHCSAHSVLRTNRNSAYSACPSTSTSMDAKSLAHAKADYLKHSILRRRRWQLRVGSAADMLLCAHRPSAETQSRSRHSFIPSTPQQLSPQPVRSKAAHLARPQLHLLLNNFPLCHGGQAYRRREGAP